MVQKPRFSLGGHMGGAGRQPRFAPILAPTRQLLARHSSFEWMDSPDMQCGSAIVALGVVVGVNASPGVSRCPCETNLIGGRVLPGGSVRRLQRTTLMVVLHSGGATCGAALDSRLLHPEATMGVFTGQAWPLVFGVPIAGGSGHRDSICRLRFRIGIQAQGACGSRHGDS